MSGMPLDPARDLLVVGLGEILWDELPGGRRLGGAPANFAVMAGKLGAHGVIASRLGRDPLGQEARMLLASMPVDTSFLQEDTEAATGSVSVAFEDGQPSYTIHAPAAWDNLQPTPAWEQLAARADAVCWGTLAQRDARSEQTVYTLLAATRPECLRIFDINLRAPFFTAAQVVRSLGQAVLLKLNDGEMAHLLSLAALPDVGATTPEALAEGARSLLAAYPNLEAAAITLGAHGSLLVTREEVLRHPGVSVRVADTVGAGDAFTAALSVHRLRGAPLQAQSEAANRWGAWVASQPGAMPELPEEVRAQIDRQITEVDREERTP